MRNCWESPQKWSGLMVWSGLVWSGMVRSGLVWSDLVWSGLVWSGRVWSGLVWSNLKISGVWQYWDIQTRNFLLGKIFFSKVMSTCCFTVRPSPPPPTLIPTEPGSQANPNTLEVYYSLPHSITYSNTAITVILPYSHTAVLYYTALLCIVVCVDTYADIWNASFQLCPHLSLSLGLYCACANSIEFLKKGNFIWRVSKKFDLQ